MEKTEFYSKYLGSFKNPELAEGAEMWKILTKFPTYFAVPAAIHHHSNYTGGLFAHSLEVTKYLEVYTIGLDLKWERPDSPYFVGMLHDLCKLDDYFYYGEEWVYNEFAQAGHGEKSVFIAEQAGIELTEEEKACIRYHMGAFTDKEFWSSYSGSIHDFSNVLYTHTADMAATHISEV